MSISSNKKVINVFNSSNLSIFDNICDSPDLCHEPTCEFYNESDEATNKFLDAYCWFCEQIDKKIKKIYPPSFCPLAKHNIMVIFFYEK